MNIHNNPMPLLGLVLFAFGLGLMIGYLFKPHEEIVADAQAREPIPEWAMKMHLESPVFSIICNDKTELVVSANGKVTYNGDLDEKSKEFWKACERYFPNLKSEIIQEYVAAERAKKE